MKMKKVKDRNRKKEWFVILNQWEVEKCKTSAQIVVYMSIKSFCGNGKLEKGISVREITERSKYSNGWVRKIAGELIEEGLVFTHGTELRRGGSVEVFSVGTEEKQQGDPSITESVPPVSRSVPDSSTKDMQSNKEIKEEQRELNNFLEKDTFKTLSFKRSLSQDMEFRAGVKINWDELSKLSDEARAKEVKGGRNA